MSKKRKYEDSGARVRYSITGKLNTKLFFRLLGVIYSINTIIVILAGVILAVYCESRIVSVVGELKDRAAPTDSAWMEVAGMNIHMLDEPSVKNTVVWPFSKLFPYETGHATRGFRAGGEGFEGVVSSITYVVDIEVGESTYEIEQNIGRFILYFIYAFAILIAYELLGLLSRTIKDRRMVKKTLDPIAELARAAQSLNEVNKQLDQEKVMALAGKLDGIDAKQLDTRIPVDDLQEELRNVAVAINGMLDRINEAYAAQMRFVSDASHELRTPIAVIQGYANLLDRWGKEDEKTLSESVSAIKDEAGNMKDLVEQLLFLARGDSNRIKFSEQPVELTSLITEVADESRMVDSGHEFIVSGDSVSIIADRALIKQALRILIDNAIKYTDGGGEIRISCETDSENARISVADNGIGIKPDIIPYVFDRFVRADESRTRATGGAGLGLSIAQWITVRHNGHVEVLSREGVGTRITLVLPVSGSRVQKAEIDTIQSPPIGA